MLVQCWQVEVDTWIWVVAETMRTESEQQVLVAARGHCSKVAG